MWASSVGVDHGQSGPEAGTDSRCGRASRAVTVAAARDSAQAGTGRRTARTMATAWSEVARRAVEYSRSYDSETSTPPASAMASAVQPMRR